MTHRFTLKLTMIVLFFLHVQLFSESAGVRVVCAMGQASNTSLLLITIDALRADSLGCYGNPLPLSPEIDRLSRHSRLFTQAYSPSPHTHPAIASILTGLSPWQHGSVFNNRHLDIQNHTLAEILSGKGYYTAALVHNAWLRPELGFAQGFHRYRQVTRYLSDASEQEGLIAFITKGESLTRPSFLWLHFLEPHADYRYHSLWWKRFKGSQSPPLDMATNDFIVAVQKGIKSIPRHFLPDLKMLYFGEIWKCDRAVGKVVRLFLNKRRKASFLITADHGEEFGEHGGLGHSHSLHAELLHVPLIFFSKPAPSENQTLNTRRISSMSVSKMLLNAIGLQKEKGVHGQSTVGDGQTLSDTTKIELNKYITAMRFFLHGNNHLLSITGDSYKCLVKTRFVQTAHSSDTLRSLALTMAPLDNGTLIKSAADWHIVKPKQPEGASLHYRMHWRTRALDIELAIPKAYMRRLNVPRVGVRLNQSSGNGTIFWLNLPQIPVNYSIVPVVLTLSHKKSSEPLRHIESLEVILKSRTIFPIVQFIPSRSYIFNIYRNPLIIPDQMRLFTLDRSSAVLYNVLNDPGEQHDLSLKKPAFTKRMVALAEKLFTHSINFNTVPTITTFDEGVQDQLKALGYLQ